MHIQELAKRLGANVDPAADVEITRVATIEDAGPGDVTFLANPRYTGKLADSSATGYSGSSASGSYPSGTGCTIFFTACS